MERVRTGNVKHRETGIELFRIITMLIIVAHHYVVNSGLMTEEYVWGGGTAASWFLVLFGWGGKTGINCFVMITGYFMCTSRITLKKFLKLLMWVELYKVIFYLIFTLSGQQVFSIKTMLLSVSPITSVGTGFTSAYLMFYLFIPFINILVKNLNKKQHFILIILLVVVYTVLPTLLVPVSYNYITWFTVIYIVSSYIRLHPEKWFNDKKLWGILTLGSLLLSWASVLIGFFVYLKTGLNLSYYFVSDSNKPLALITAVCAFMFFKNLKLRYSGLINTVAASAFGVLLIHANSDAMRQWLWKDLLNNVGMFGSNLLPLHAIGSVVGIYIVCTLIDMIRIKFVEKPVFHYLEKKKIV